MILLELNDLSLIFIFSMIWIIKLLFKGNALFVNHRDYFDENPKEQE